MALVGVAVGLLVGGKVGASVAILAGIVVTAGGVWRACVGWQAVVMSKTNKRRNRF